MSQTSVQFINNNNATNQLTLTLGSNVVAGNLIVVLLGWAAAEASPEVTSMTDGLGNTYANTGVFVTDSTNAVGGAIWYTVVTTGGACTITINFSHSIDHRGIAHEFSNTAGWAASPFDQGTGVGGASGTPPASGSFTTTGSDDLLVGFEFDKGGTAHAQGTGWSLGSSVGGRYRDEYQLDKTAGSYNADWATNAGGGWVAVAAGFLSASATVAPALPDELETGLPAPGAYKFAVEYEDAPARQIFVTQHFDTDAFEMRPQPLLASACFAEYEDFAARQVFVTQSHDGDWFEQKPVPLIPIAALNLFEDNSNRQVFVVQHFDADAFEQLLSPTIGRPCFAEYEDFATRQVFVVQSFDGDGWEQLPTALIPFAARFEYEDASWKQIFVAPIVNAFDDLPDQLPIAPSPAIRAEYEDSPLGQIFVIQNFDADAFEQRPVPLTPIAAMNLFEDWASQVFVQQAFEDSFEQKRSPGIAIAAMNIFEDAPSRPVFVIQEFTNEGDQQIPRAPYLNRWLLPGEAIRIIVPPAGKIVQWDLIAGFVISKLAQVAGLTPSMSDAIEVSQPQCVFANVLSQSRTTSVAGSGTISSMTTLGGFPK